MAQGIPQYCLLAGGQVGVQKTAGLWDGDVMQFAGTTPLQCRIISSGDSLPAWNGPERKKIRKSL